MPTKEQLADLILVLANSRWPAYETDSAVRNQVINAQSRAPLVDPALLRVAAPNEVGIVLIPPPYQPVLVEVEWYRARAAQHLGGYDYWKEHGALGEIDPAEAILIADFGHGSDTAAIMDFRYDPAPILRLHWSGRDGEHNHWDRMADSIQDLLEKLDLTIG